MKKKSERKKNKLDMNITDSKGKVLNIKFDPKEYTKGFFNKYYDKSNGILNSFDYKSSLVHLTNPTRSLKNIVVNMQDRIVYNDPNIQQERDIQQVGDVQQEEPSSLNRGKKRTLESVEDSNVDKRGKTALDSTTLDFLNIGGLEENSTANFESIVNNTIIENDLIDNAFNYDSIYWKISNLIELRKVDHKDAITKLNFETKELKNNFYIMIKALNLSNYKDVSLTKIQTLLKGLEKFIDVTPSNPNSINKYDFISDDLNYINVYEKISDLIYNKDNDIGPRNRLSSLIFEPKSLRSEFYNSIRALNLTNYKSIPDITLGNLLKALKHEIHLIFFYFHITEDDFLKDFKYHVIYNKVFNLIKSGEVDKKHVLVI